MNEHIKVLREWSEVERWSAYDTGTVYYAEVMVGDNREIFNSPEERFDPYDWARKRLAMRQKEKRIDKLMSKHYAEGLSRDEALEFVNLKYAKQDDIVE